MKNLTSILSLSLFIFAVACNKDDSSSLSGTWNLSEARCDDGSTTSSGGGVSLTSTFTSIGKNYAATVTFNDDGTYSSQGTYTATISTTSSGQTIVQEVNIPEFAGSGTWELNGNTFTVKDDQGNTNTAEVVENTSTTFKYKVLVNNTNSNAGFTTVTTGTYYFTLSK